MKEESRKRVCGEIWPEDGTTLGQGLSNWSAWFHGEPFTARRDLAVHEFQILSDSEMSLVFMINPRKFGEAKKRQRGQAF